MSSTDDATEGLTSRVPCIDDMCTGVLDAKGVCGTCGKQGDVSLLERVADEDASGPDAAEAAEARGERTDDDGDAIANERDHAPDEARDEIDEDETPDPDERVPCGDDMCTGIIGADGKCGTCGKAA
jgi:hypothetical protein